MTVDPFMSFLLQNKLRADQINIKAIEAVVTELLKIKVEGYELIKYKPASTKYTSRMISWKRSK
jgi:hypothetical protein